MSPFLFLPRLSSTLTIKIIAYELMAAVLKLRPFVRPYRLLVIATLILTLIGSFTAQVNALTLQYAVDSINALLEKGQDWSKAGIF